MVRHEDLPHAQHPHHYGVVLEEDRHDGPPPGASRKVSADLGALGRNAGSPGSPLQFWFCRGPVQVVMCYLGW